MARLDKIGKTATTVTKDENGRLISVRYHETDVVTLKTGQNIIMLNTGGWRTVTTKARMNQVSNVFNLGYYVFQKNHKWFVEFKGKTIPFDYRELELNAEAV